MLIGISLGILIMLVVFSLIFEGSPVGAIESIFVDVEGLFTDEFASLFIAPQDVIFSIDTSSLIISGIAILATVIIVASLVGIQFLGSGLSNDSVRILILLTAFIGLWTSLSLLAFNLIKSIEVFGSMIYIILTIAYVIGVSQKIS